MSSFHYGASNSLYPKYDVEVFRTCSTPGKTLSLPNHKNLDYLGLQARAYTFLEPTMSAMW